MNKKILKREAKIDEINEKHEKELRKLHKELASL